MLTCGTKTGVLKLGIIREGKIPTDNRVALTPAQCRWLKINHPEIIVTVQPSPHRCFTDNEYLAAGVQLNEDLSACDVLLGIKEVPLDMLIPGKTYLFFSHTIKQQPYNQKLMHEIIRKKITLIDYECLTHNDGARIIGFGFFAGVVGAHNGIRAYGMRTGLYDLPKVNSSKNLQYLIHTYFGLKLPNIKIAVTGSGRVAHGLLEIMNLLGVHEVEPEQYLVREFEYPVFVHLKGGLLYEDENGNYNRNEFHAHPQKYKCTFRKYLSQTDILMNGIYWDQSIPRLFELEDISSPDFRIQTIADVTDDMHGSVPCNLGDSTIDDPVYGVDKITYEKTAPYLPTSIDIMAVGNLPNELPREASRHFGEHLIKYIMGELASGKGEIIERATVVKNGELTEHFAYLKEYAGV